MDWLNHSLNKKFIIGTAAGLLISSLVFLILFIGLYRGELARERTETVTQVNRLLQTSLENAMLKRDLDGLRDIVLRLGGQDDITRVMITNPAGEIRFSSREADLGKQLLPLALLGHTAETQFTQDDDGNHVLRSINPVHNKLPCMPCHGPVDKSPINGVLYVDYDAAPIRRSAQNTTLLLMGSGALIVLINLTGGWWFIRRFVLRPVDKLSAVSERLSHGDLQARVDSQGADELARLGNAFDRMATNLQSKMHELQEKEHFLQQLVDAIPDGVRIIDENYKIRLTNKTYRQQLGLPLDSPVMESCYASSHGRDTPCPITLLTCPINEIKQNPEPIKVVHRHQQMDGSHLDVEIFAAPMHVTQVGVPRTLIVESIRDLEQEVRFSHEQKLSELGRLAAGVAHEIHNPLASVRLALHAAIESNNATVTDREELHDYLQLVDREVDKCIKVTERLLRLSAPPSAQTELVQINEIIDDTLSLARWEIEKSGVKCNSHLEPALRILATDSEIRMLLLNLIQNALHAMPQGGELKIQAARQSGRIEVHIDDTGVGIRTEDLPRIFDPFFSRRADGVRGTGLGLSISKTIVENYGGTLNVNSTLGTGTSFVVSFADADGNTGEEL